MVKKEGIKKILNEFVGRKATGEYMASGGFYGYRMIGMYNNWFKRLLSGELTDREEFFLFWYHAGFVEAEGK